MKTLVAIMIAASILGSTAQASSDPDPYVKIFANVYLRAQVMQQLKSYLNKNPNVIGSTKPLVGTAAVKYLSQALAVHSFLTAKNDTDRLFAVAEGFATNPALAANPVVAVALFAARICVSVNNLKLQKSLQEIYERVAKLNNESWQNIKRSHNAEASIYQKRLDLIASALKQIGIDEENLTEGVLYRRLSGEDISISAFEIESAINLLFKLHVRYFQTASIVSLFLRVNPAEIGMKPEVYQVYQNLQLTLSRNAQEFEVVKTAFEDVYRLALIEDLMSYRTRDQERAGAAYVECLGKVGIGSVTKTDIEKCVIQSTNLMRIK